MNQLPVLDGLVLARTSKVWRDASHDVLGYLRTYAATMRDFALLSKSAMAKPITSAEIAADGDVPWGTHFARPDKIRICNRRLQLTENPWDRFWHAAERERITNERAELLEAEVTHRRVIYRAKILERLESLSVNSEVWRPVYGPLKAKYAGPVIKLTGLGWEEMRTLSD